MPKTYNRNRKNSLRKTRRNNNRRNRNNSLRRSQKNQKNQKNQKGGARKQNKFFQLMMNAKKNNLESFQYNNNTYNRQVKGHLTFYKKA